MRGDGQGRERSSSYDRGRMYSPYVSEKRDEGRPYPENDNDYRKSVGDAEVSDLNQPYHCFERPSYLKRFNISEFDRLFMLGEKNQEDICFLWEIFQVIFRWVDYGT